MRYITGALSVLLVIIGTATVNSRHMVTITGQATAYVEESLAAEEADSQTDAVQTARALDHFWNGHRSYLESVLMHSELDDITVTISDFISAIETGDKDAVHANGRLLCVQFQHLAELELFRIGNIL